MLIVERRDLRDPKVFAIDIIDIIRARVLCIGSKANKVRLDHCVIARLCVAAISATR